MMKIVRLLVLFVVLYAFFVSGSAYLECGAAQPVTAFYCPGKCSSPQKDKCTQCSLPQGNTRPVIASAGTGFEFVNPNPGNFQLQQLEGKDVCNANDAPGAYQANIYTISRVVEGTGQGDCVVTLAAEHSQNNKICRTAAFSALATEAKGLLSLLFSR